MSDPEHLAILQDASDKQDVTIWNYWRIQHRDVKPDLSAADLRNARLRKADLREAQLGNADLRYARLSDADLRNADLRGARLCRARLDWAALNGANLMQADLCEADLHTAELVEANLTAADLTEAKLGRADLTGADLTGANLTGAHLDGTRLERAQLSNADFTGAILDRTDIVDVDLHTVKGLEATRHVGPSHIDINTLYKSGGNIPAAFLRGAGVPGGMVTYVHHQLREAQVIPFYSVFISSAFQDQGLAERLHADLQAQSIRVWFRPQDLNLGDPSRQTVEQTVRDYDKLILVLSANSIDRPWARHVFSQTLEKEKQHNQPVLFPICLDDSVSRATEQWILDIRRRPIGDFTRWQNQDDYYQAFALLLRDLQAS